MNSDFTLAGIDVSCYFFWRAGMLVLELGRLSWDVMAGVVY